MAVVEICDVCGKQVNLLDGITLKCSDMNGLHFIGIDPVREKRDYKVRICDKCVENIKAYCKKFRE